MQPSTLSERLGAGLRDFAWDEWAQMGVFAAARRVSGWAQDPEALLVFTLDVAREDPRLFDALLDWLLVGERLLSVRRLRAMCDGDEDKRLVDAAIAWLAQHRPRARLAPRTQAVKPHAELEPLFIGLHAHVRRPDPAFAAAGWLRPVVEPNDTAGRPDLAAPINLAFRLRELLGVGARAEVVRFLLTVDAPAVNAQLVARSAGFAKRNVHEALASLHAAGPVQRWTIGNEQRYELDRRAWAQLLGLEPGRLPTEQPWPQLLRATRTLARWLRQSELDDLSPYLRASRARDLLEKIRPDVEFSGVHVGNRPGEAAWDDLEALVEELLRRLTAPSAHAVAANAGA